MASQNAPPPGQRPSYPPFPQNTIPLPIGNLPSHMQTLNISRPVSQASPSPPLQNPLVRSALAPPPSAPSSMPLPSGVPSLNPAASVNSAPPAAAMPIRAPVPPFSTTPAQDPFHPVATANGPQRIPPNFPPPGAPFTGTPPVYQQGTVPRGPQMSAPPVQMVQSGAPSAPPPPQMVQSGVPLNYPMVGSTSVPSVGSIRPPVSQPPAMSGPPMYPQRPQVPPAAYSAPTPSSVPLTRSVAPPGMPQTWAGAPPTFSAPPSLPRPQNVPGMPTQITAPSPSPSMGQYLAPGVSQPSSPAAQGRSPSQIDPSQIPRSQTSSLLIEFETRVNGQAAQPPSATSNFIARDMGNCSPRYMRSTLYQVPCSSELLANSCMPLALLVQPLALPHPSEEPIQVVDFGESGPVRCAKCKAYINPFMRFIDQGHRFKCNFCGHTNDTPRDYHCNLGPDNRRRDADSRPELCRGTVEFVATKEFLVRPPMLPVFFFLIDVSMNAVTSGATGAACSAVQRALADLSHNPRVKVGIATYDSTLHFYNFNQAKQPSMLVVPDVQDVYAPLRSRLTVTLTEYQEELEQLLENIPSMFQGNMIADSAFGAAIKGVSLAIKSNGGKLLVFQSGLPSIGFAALTARESESKKGPAPSEKDQNKLWQPVDKTLKTLAIELAEYQICCDLFLTTQEYVDIASLAVIPATTGGQIYYYYPFSATSDSAKLYNDLRWNLTRSQGLEAVMRVRCSQGLQVQEYSGNFHKGTPTDLDLPSIDCDKAVMVSFKHDDKLQDGSECCFQCALLYTTMDGERRIRVSTLSLPCTTVLSNVFRGADLDAQFTYFMKQASLEASSTPLSQLREKMTISCVNILYTYRKFCATTLSSGQLILPEALKLLPLYTLALIKSIGLRSSDIRTDDRCYWLSHVSSISPSLAIPTVYPRMYSIHDLASKNAGNGSMPETLYLSSENLSGDGIFLLETGEDAFIYVGKAVSPDLLFQLFGVRSVNDIQANQFILQEFDNDASRKLNALVNEIRKDRCSYLRFRWCRRGDPLEFLFFSLIVEDKNSLGSSYVEYLVHVHRLIQNKST